MKEGTRQRLVKLILEELSDKIKTHESLGQKLEPFADLPVEKVADAILKQFEYLLSSDLRDLIIHLIEQEVAAEKGEEELQAEILQTTVDVHVDQADRSSQDSIEPEVEAVSAATDAESTREPAAESIMEHFGTK